MSKTDITVLPLPQLIARCRHESERFYQQQPYDPHFCLELFRRAIMDGEELSWEAVYQQYRPSVAAWVRRCPSFPVTREQVDYFVNRAFEKFWAAVTPAKFGRFPDLKSLLRYLKMCVYGAVTDYARLKELANYDPSVDPDLIISRAGSNSMEEVVLNRAAGRQLWQLIEARLLDDAEHAVIYASYVLGLKPRQVQEEFPRLFADAQAVSRIKANVLARLRRDDRLLSLLSDA